MDSAANEAPATTTKKKKMSRGGRLVVSGLLAVVGAALMLVFVLHLASQPGAQVKLGKDVFEVGKTSWLSREIERQGPLLFPDPLGGNRELVLARGKDNRWLAFEGRLASGCRLLVDPSRKALVDACSGLPVDPDPPPSPSYPVRVDEKGTVIVDLRKP